MCARPRAHPASPAGCLLHENHCTRSVVVNLRKLNHPDAGNTFSSCRLFLPVLSQTQRAPSCELEVFCFLFYVFFCAFSLLPFRARWTLSAPTQRFCLLLFLLFSALSETLYCTGSAAVAAGVAAHLCKFHGGEALDFFGGRGWGSWAGLVFDSNLWHLSVIELF